jgi:hypothetical protein
MKIAIVGKGNVGSALAEGLRRTKHEVRFASQDPKEPIADVVAWGDAVILAVPWTAHKVIAASAGSIFDGKTVVDVSNVMTPNMELAMGFTTSGAEELQKLLPKAKVVKAFNTIFAQNMKDGRQQRQQRDRTQDRRGHRLRRCRYRAAQLGALSRTAGYAEHQARVWAENGHGHRLYSDQGAHHFPDQGGLISGR